MKFGVQLYDRATAKWRNYNIDYNELKNAIRIATSEDVGSSEEDANDASESSASLQGALRAALRAMYRAFEEQIELVSLFVDSKVGEIQRRLVALKRQCNLLVKQAQGDEGHSAVFQRVTDRKLAVYRKDLEAISKDVQDLSRFILLQKIAIRKLFKKFLKHSTYARKQQLVDKMTCKFLVEDPKAFTNANLKDLSSEMSLLFDFLQSFNEQTLEPNDRKRQTSIHTLDSLQFPARNQLSTTNPLASRIATFDIISKKKGPRILSFWVHSDNLNEIKFYLSSHFKLITDESLLVEEHALSPKKPRRGSNVKLRETRSSLNLATDANKPSQNVADNQDHDFTPETETTVVWLNNPTTPLMTSSPNATQHSANDSTPTFQADPYPHVCLSTPSLVDPVLFTPVGGLRQFTIATLNQQLMKDLFVNQISDKDAFKQHMREEYAKHKIVGNPTMADISLDWVIESGVKPLAQVRSNRLRYITTDKSEQKISSYISLDWGIESFTDDVLDLSHPPSTKNRVSFKHAILEIHFDSNVQDLPQALQKLINSHLVYQVDQLNFSLNNYLVCRYVHDSLSDSCIINYVAPWFDIYDSADIRKIPSIEEPEPEGGILLNKDEGHQPQQSQQAGYWNEFDNGSDFGDDNNGFYLEDTDSDENGAASDNGPGLEWMSEVTMNKILEYANTLTRWVEMVKNGGSFREQEALLRPVERHYSLYNDGSDEDGSRKSALIYGAINSRETIKYANHDHVLSFVYMSSLFVSYLLSGIGISIIVGLFQYSQSISFTWIGATVIGVAMLALLISVLLSVAGVCLSMYRYKHAPLWHYVFIWLGVSFSSLGLIFGMTLFA